MKLVYKDKFLANDTNKIVYMFESEIEHELKTGATYNVDKERKKRSLDANAYFWKLCEQIADKLDSDKDSIYLQMLERYGVFTHIVTKPNMVEKVAQQFKLFRNLGEVQINGTKGIQLQVYYGSSTYDNIEMSRLIRGIESECREMGIPTLEDIRVQQIIDEWQK